MRSINQWLGGVACILTGCLILSLGGQAWARDGEDNLKKTLDEQREDGQVKKEVARDGDRVKEDPRDGDRVKEGPRDGDWVKEGPRDGDRVKEGPRDGDRVKEGPRDGDRVKEGPRDGDRIKEGAREGDRAKVAAREGDRVKDGAREGDRIKEGPSAKQREGDKPLKLRIKTIRGELIGLTRDTITLAVGDGRKPMELQLDDGTGITLDRFEASLEDLPEGAIVQVKAVEGLAVVIDARTPRKPALRRDSERK